MSVVYPIWGEAEPGIKGWVFEKEGKVRSRFVRSIAVLLRHTVHRRHVTAYSP